MDRRKAPTACVWRERTRGRPSRLSREPYGRGPISSRTATATTRDPRGKGLAFASREGPPRRLAGRHCHARASTRRTRDAPTGRLHRGADRHVVDVDGRRRRRSSTTTSWSLSCECGENTAAKPAGAMTALHDWLGRGRQSARGPLSTRLVQGQSFGRLPNHRDVACASIASGFGTYTVDTSIPKGKDFAHWRVGKGLVSDAGTPRLSLTCVRSSVSTVPSSSTPWIRDPSSSNDAKLLEFATDEALGRVEPA